MIDEKKFSTLVKAADWEGARRLIEDYVTQSISEDERAEALTMLASLYLQVKNDITRGYLEALRDIRATISDVESKGASARRSARAKSLGESLKD